MDAKLIYLLYRTLEWAASPFILIYFTIRVFKDRRYLRRFQERLGFLPPRFRQPSAGAVWLHAVSVGEVLSSTQFLRQLRMRMPSAPLFLSTSTLAGRALAEEKLAGLVEGVFYAPLDYCFAVRRVLRTLRPSVVIVAETEIWPNLYREAKRNGCGLAVVGGRISDRAYPRYRRWAWFFRQALRWPDAILAQDSVSLNRYLALGAPQERTADGGNLKYDCRPSQSPIPQAVQDFLGRTGPRELWIAASTMPPAAQEGLDEDDVVIATFGSLAAAHPGLLLILVPRRPERFHVVAQKLEASGVPFARRSLLDSDSPALALPGVLLVDSIGELSSLFALPSVVLMGGTLANRGGHNILEPAFFGRAVVVGPHMENFAGIAKEFIRMEGCLAIGSPDELGHAIDGLLRDPERSRQLGDRARELAGSKRGATARAVSLVAELYDRAVPHFRPTLPVYQPLWLLSVIWRVGTAWKRTLHRALLQRLATPVVSVGGLSMGGSGKTPFVLWLAERLKAAGTSPAILTRGYRRRAPERQTVLDAGARASVARTGDEAQLLLRSGVAPVGIGVDRRATGRAVEQKFHPDVLILDDGFQHWRLGRDLDIVLIDALDPFGGGAVFPLGKLREPPEALRRADLFVITRAEPGRTYSGIEARLRQHNPAAPIFKARVRPDCWIDGASGEQYAPAALPVPRVAAFCALANPASFWRTLASLGLDVVARRELADHHRYKPIEMKRLAAEARLAGAEALLTTEKDAMNFCEHVPELIAPLRLFWLRIGVEVEQGEGLLAMVTGLHVRS